MEIYYLQNDISVFGFPVETFPIGIKEAFDSLTETLSFAEMRRYFGISFCNKETTTYIAAAEEKHTNENQLYNLQSYVVAKRSLPE